MSGIKIERGVAVVPESRPFYDIFNGGKGGLKSTAFILEVSMWGSEDIGSVATSWFHDIAKPISKASALAAPICCFPEVVKFADKARRELFELFEEVTWSRFENFSHTLLNIAQRIAEFVHGLMKLEIIGDALQMLFFKQLKSGIQMFHYVYEIRDVNASDAKLHTIKDVELREWQRMENNAKIISVIASICSNSVALIAIIFEGVITGKIMLAIGIASFVTGVTAHYIKSYREGYENKMDADRVNHLIEMNGGWDAA